MTLERGIRRSFRSSEIREVYDELVQMGGMSWVDGGSHVAVRLPDGKVIRMSTTATGRRYVAILRSQMRRGASPARRPTTRPLGRGSRTGLRRRRGGRR